MFKTPDVCFIFIYLPVGLQVGLYLVWFESTMIYFIVLFFCYIC